MRGHTQLDTACSWWDGGAAVFSHPVDLHYETHSLDSWPRIRLEVYHGRQDSQELCGYGICALPMTAGRHTIQCQIWRPAAVTWWQWVAGMVWGTRTALRNPERVLVHQQDRSQLVTESMGTITLILTVITRNFEKFGEI